MARNLAGLPLSQRRGPLLKLSLPSVEVGSNDDDTPAGFEDALDMGIALGSGTVAVVRLATRKSNGRQIAVKCLRSSDEELRQFTRDEYELVRSLSHPAIVKFEELWESRSRVYICMEFCCAGSIDSYSQAHGPFSVDAARDLGTQLLRGVNYLHHKRVVHRDLKPENILLKRDASLLKITDFNSAKRIGQHGPAASLMLTDRGTRVYSAPELLFGRLWNERIDVWACGLVFFFMFRLELPFNICDSATAEVLSKGRLPDVAWGEIDDSMVGLIKQCLVVDVHARPGAVSLILHPALRILRSPARPGGKSQPLLARRPSGGASVDQLRAEQLRASQLGYQGDVFSLLHSCGLVAIYRSKFRAKRFSLTPLNLDFNLSPGGYNAVHQSGPSTCYLPDVDVATPSGGTSPGQVRKKSFFSFKEPRRFDALLKSAVQNFES